MGERRNVGDGDIARNAGATGQHAWHRRDISCSLNRLSQSGHTSAIDGIENLPVALHRGSDNDAIGKYEVCGCVRSGHAAAYEEGNFGTGGA
ncbi:MAG: hypothetical protein WCD63_04140, partial [Terrimicrobiaceae bacterium]